MNLRELGMVLSQAGCKRFYAKTLAENDNSKNQIYLAPGFAALNVFPNLIVDSDAAGPRKRTTFKAALRLHWILPNGNSTPAPHAKLIFYPKYPEVRLSGFLLGCSGAPSDILRSRIADRILIWGVCEDGRVYAKVVMRSSAIGKEISQCLPPAGKVGFSEIRIPCENGVVAADAKELLLREFRRIHEKGWIISKRLLRDGSLGECRAPNCGGYTLEAELGIRPNGISEPDFLGWEIKQHSVRRFDRIETGAITLMTPEPKGGVYTDDGVLQFLKRFGYKDLSGKEDRINFGGVHRVGHEHPRTHLQLEVRGFDRSAQRITDSSGGICLAATDGTVAAKWPFSGLMKHWNRKHAYAAYVASMCRKAHEREYAYGPCVRLGQGTDFMLFLAAVEAGHVYYDPGIKVESVSTKPRIKRRSQFRVHSKHIPALYSHMSTEQVVDN